MRVILAEYEGVGVRLNWRLLGLRVSEAANTMFTQVVTRLTSWLLGIDHVFEHLALHRGKQP